MLPKRGKSSEHHGRARKKRLGSWMSNKARGERKVETDGVIFFTIQLPVLFAGGRVWLVVILSISLVINQLVSWETVS